MLAAMFDAQELVLEDDEAKKLSDALNRVAVHYEKEFNPVVMVWANLLTVSGAIYGPKLWQWRKRVKQESTAAAPNPNVTQMPKKAAAAPTAPPAAPAQPQTPADVFGDFNGAALPELG